MIEKSPGITPTEKLLIRLCENTFLKLWSYPNPFYQLGTELCDLIAIFDQDVFLFFDRETTQFQMPIQELEKIPDEAFQLRWKRWKKKQLPNRLTVIKYHADGFSTTGIKYSLMQPVKIYCP